MYAAPPWKRPYRNDDPAFHNVALNEDRSCQKAVVEAAREHMPSGHVPHGVANGPKLVEKK